MAAVVVNNQKWAYLGQYKNGRVGPMLGKPNPYFVKHGNGYRPRRGDPTLDPLAVAVMHAGNGEILPGRSDLGNYVPGPIQNIAPRITFSERGAALQWPPAPEEEIQGYHIERSHEPGHPLLSFLRITPSPINRLTHQDLWAFEGESVAYRIYTVLPDGSVRLRAELQGTQTPFAVQYITTQFVVDGTNTSSSKVTIFENLHFRSPNRTHAIRVKTGNRVLFRNCTCLTSADFMLADGGARVEIEQCLIKGKMPMDKNYSAGWAFRGDYLRAFAFRNNIVRELSGVALGQWRGPTAAQGGPITRIMGNVFHNLHRKRSDGMGGTLADDTIVSAHKERGVRGQSDPGQTGGFTVPIGWDFAQAININAASNPQDNLPAQFFGGLEVLGNFVLQEPGIGLMEDAFSTFSQGGESWDRPYAIRGWCMWGNYGNGINAQGQRWQPGMPWHQGNQKQPPGSYIQGVTQPSGEYTFPFQSMTGGLMQDGANYSKYSANGAYVLVEDGWLLGPGTTLGTQHSHDMQIRRVKALYTGKDRSGQIGITGDPRVGIYMDNYDGSKIVEGQPLSHHLGISDSTQIRPMDLVKNPQGFSTRWTDPTLTKNNSAISRLATPQEEQDAYLEFLTWCETHGVTLGPQFPPPAVVYS